MSETIAPPYPADTRARGWRFEIDMETIKASETWLRAKTGFLRGALLLLWSEAWQQTPCGTLPGDDELVALLIDMPAATFVKHRAILMRGWRPSTDGRLYHETVTKRVLAMLAKRASDAERAANRRARKAESELNPPEVAGESRVTPDGPTREFDTKHQAPEERKHIPPPKGAMYEPEGFTEFWEAWPRGGRKGAKAECLKVWSKDRLEAHAETILAHVRVMAASVDWTKEGGQYVPAPLVYLRGKRWDGADVSQRGVFEGVL